MLQKERTVERRKTESEAAPPVAGPSQDETGELTFLRTEADKGYGLTLVYSQNKIRIKIIFCSRSKGKWVLRKDKVGNTKKDRLYLTRKYTNGVGRSVFTIQKQLRKFFQE